MQRRKADGAGRRLRGKRLRLPFYFGAKNPEMPRTRRTLAQKAQGAEG